MASPDDNLALLKQQAATAHARHAARPDVWGIWMAALSLWARYYEANAALRDANPLFAALLLPALAPTATPAPGLPLVPTGSLSVVDFAGPGTATLTLDITGPITIAITSPAGVAIPATVTPGPTRQTTTFAATTNGLYRATAKVGNTTVATLYVSVERELLRKFRQLSRYLKFDFSPERPVLPDNYLELLAVLYFMDAAAATGQVELYGRLRSQAFAIESAPAPIALFGK